MLKLGRAPGKSGIVLPDLPGKASGSDRGGSRIMKEFPGRVMEFPAGEEELKDIDYPENMR